MKLCAEPPWADPEGGGGAGGPDPLEHYKNIGFLSNTGRKS